MFISTLNFNNFVLWVKTHYKIILLFFVFFLLGGIFHYYWTMSYALSHAAILNHFKFLHYYMASLAPAGVENLEQFPKFEICSNLYQVPELKQVLINQPGTDTITTGVHLNKSYIQHCPNKESANSLANLVQFWPENMLAVKHLKTNCYCMEVHDMFRQSIDKIPSIEYKKN